MQQTQTRKVVHASELAAQHGHQSIDSCTTLATIVVDGAEFELRICGKGEGAFFEWINEGGDPVGDVIDSLGDIDVEKQRFASAARSKKLPDATIARAAENFWAAIVAAFPEMPSGDSQLSREDEAALAMWCNADPGDRPVFAGPYIKVTWAASDRIDAALAQGIAAAAQILFGSKDKEIPVHLADQLRHCVRHVLHWNPPPAVRSFDLAAYVDARVGNMLIPAPVDVLDHTEATDEKLPADFKSAVRMLSRPYLEISKAQLRVIEAMTEGRGDILIVGGVKATWGNCDGKIIAIMPLTQSLNAQRESASVDEGSKAPKGRKLSSRSLAEQYPAKGSMPRDVVCQLYALREKEVMELQQKGSIGAKDLAHLDRGARVAVASLLYAKCDTDARRSLLHDEHPHVRSCAELAREECERMKSHGCVQVA